MTTNTKPTVGLGDFNRSVDEVLGDFTDSGASTTDFLVKAQVDVDAARDFTVRAVGSLGEIAKEMNATRAYGYGFISGLAFGAAAARAADQRAASDA